MARSSAAPRPQPPPELGAGIAFRIRERLAEMGGVEGAEAVLRRLEGGSDVRIDALTDLARRLGVPLTWLLYGESAPEGVRLRDLPGWTAAARDAVERLGGDEAAVHSVGDLRLPAPRHIDGQLLAALARAWREAEAPAEPAQALTPDVAHPLLTFLGNDDPVLASIRRTRERPLPPPDVLAKLDALAEEALVDLPPWLSTEEIMATIESMRPGQK